MRLNCGFNFSGMILPQKVIRFLDFAGNCDLSLLFVMASSAGVYFVLHCIVLKNEKPLFDAEFHVPTNTKIDGALISGAALFGISWG